MRERDRRFCAVRDRASWRETAGIGAGDDGLSVVGARAVGRTFEVGVRDSKCPRIRAVDGLAHPVDVGGVTRVRTVELAEGRQIRIGDLLVEKEDAVAVTGVSALQHLECRRVGIGDGLAVDFAGDDREMSRVLGEHRPVAPIDDMAVLREVAGEQYEVRLVVADHTVALGDVMAVLGGVGSVEQFEAAGGGVGELVAADEDRRLVRP